MPIIELKSRGVELDFPDSMSDQEIQDAIDKEYPRDGKDVAYELEQFRNAALTGGDLSNPFDQMSDDDYIKLRQYQDKEKKSWSDLFGIAKDTFSTIYDDVIQGAGSSIYNAATGKAGQVAESAKQGMIAGTIGISDLATKIVDPSKPIPTKEDFLKQTKDQPLETMADEAAPFFRKQVKNTEEDYLALVKNEKRKDSESFNRILAMESTLRGAPIEDVAAAFQYVDPTLLAGVASAGVKTLAKTLLKKGAQETAQASVEAAAREAAQRAAQQSAETIEGGGMREVVLNQAENLAQGVQSAASLPGKVMQAVKEGAEAIAPGTGAPAQAAAMTAAAMTDLGITASVLAGTKTIEKAAEVAGSIARAAKQGASRAGFLERAALDPKISGSARAFANGLAQIQPLFGVGVRTAKQAAKGALAGAGVGAGLGYLADGEEGAAAGFGAGAAFGSMFGTLGSLWDVSKEAIGGSTARTRQNAAGDIGRFIAEKPPQEQAGWTSVFNNLAAKSGLEKAAHSMDALKIAEAAGAEVRLATPDEIAKWNSPGWANHNEISGKQELVLNPSRILSDTAPHETAHIHFNAATNNLFKPEMFKAIVGSVDPVDGKVISEGLFNNEGLARIADDIAKAYGKANESQKNLFSNYADQLRNSLEPENLAKAREAIVDELTATYVGKAFNRSKAGRFNPDRLPLLYRRALDSIHEGFFNKLRATIYEKGNVLNMRDISKAFIDDKGRPIRIPELDAIFKKAFTNKLKAVDENTAPVDRIPVNLNDRAIWARSYGNMSGVLNPDNTVKSAAQIDREAVQRWQDMTARLSALPENQRLGLSFGRDDKGKTTMTAKGQISEEAINAILASDSIDQTAKSFLREVFTSIKDPQKTTLDTRYYGVYTRGKGTSKMVAGVKPASQNEILPYSIEFNSKDGIIVRAVDMTKVRDRLADALRKPDFKDAFKDYNQAMRAFRTYLDNLTLDKPVESSIILGGGELGNKRRNLFYDALDFRPAQGDEIRNNPLKRATGKSNPIKSYRIERFTRLSPTRDKFAFEEGTTYTRVKSNYQPDSFTPETLPNGEAWTNPDGYRILKKTGSKLYRVYDDSNESIGVASTFDKAVKMAQRKFIDGWHGSPHNFMRFTTQKIGTGEGAQAYGYGLYIAENKGVAQGYREALTTSQLSDQRFDFPNVLYKGEHYLSRKNKLSGKEGNGVSLIAEKLRTIDNPEEAKKLAIKTKEREIKDEIQLYKDGILDEMPDISGLEQDIEAIKYIDVSKIKKLNEPYEPGSLYRVQLNVMPDQLLDWDKPLSEQPKSVQKFAEKYGIALDYQGNVYRALHESFIKSGKPEPAAIKEKKLAKELSKAGIPGIRYLDQGSRSTGEGTSNYVIFDDGLIRIVDRNNKPVGKRLFRDVAEKGYSLRFQPDEAKDSFLKSEKKAENVRFQPITPEQDAAYINAVKSGDSETAQKMVDEAAKAAGYDIGPVYHGTKGKIFTIFDPSKGNNMAYGPGFYFAESPERAALYGDNVITAYLKINDLGRRRDTGVQLGENGYRTKLGDWVVKLDSQESIKSADPITYDNSGNVIPLSQRFNPGSNDIRFQPITPEQDAAFVAAEKAGDVETGSKLAAEAAYSSGFKKEGYHGTHRDFTIFDRLNAEKDRIGLKLDTVGNWFTDSPATARSIYGPKVVKAFLELKKPLRFDGVGGLEDFRSEVEQSHGSVEAFRKWAKSKGYDGVEISGDFVDGELQTIQIVFDPNQIKSADPFTYDDAGNLIPLSQRFNPSSSDIRFQPDEGQPPNASSINFDQKGLDDSPIRSILGGALQFNPNKVNEKYYTEATKAAKAYGAGSDFIQSRQSEVSRQVRDQMDRLRSEKLRSDEAILQQFIDAFPSHKVKEGGEHYTYIPDDGDFVLKLTKPSDESGVGFVGLSIDEDVGQGFAQKEFRRLGFRPAAVSEYIARTANFSKLFDIPWQVTEIVQNKLGQPVIVSLMKKIEGDALTRDKADLKAVNDYMAKRGFKPLIEGPMTYHKNYEHIPESTYYNPNTGQLISDADPRNFVRTKSGKIEPVDLLINVFNPKYEIRFQPDPSMPSVLNGSNGTRIIKSNSGKFRVYSVTGVLLGIRDTQQAAEKLAAKP